nr:hypothetical protein [Aquisalimonas sp.]
MDVAMLLDRCPHPPRVIGIAQIRGDLRALRDRLSMPCQAPQMRLDGLPGVGKRLVTGPSERAGTITVCAQGALYRVEQDA